jgi:hypothetical protein
MGSCGDPMIPDEAWHMDCGYSSKSIPEVLHEFFPGLRNADEGKFGLGTCFKTVQTSKYNINNLNIIMRHYSIIPTHL